MTWRVAVLALAILVSGALAPLVVEQTGGGLSGHRWAGLFVGSLIVVGTLGTFFGTRTAESRAPAASEPSLRAQLAVAVANASFRALLLCSVIQAVGVATMLAGVQYFADHVLVREAGATLLFAAFVGPALLVMPLWSRIGAGLGKRRSLIVASLLFAAGALALLAAPGLAPAGVYLIVAVIGCGYAGQQVFVLSMLPDCIAADTERTGRRQAGVFTGLWTAGETLGLALGPGLYALVLQLFGYVSSATGEAAAQDDTARLGVLLGFTVLPAVLVGAAVVLLRGYADTRRLPSPCRPPRTPRSPRPRTTCGSRWTWCRSARTCVPTRWRRPRRSAPTRCWWRRPHRRTRTAWSTRSRRSPRSVRSAACGAMWTPASAAGRCRTCGGSVPTCPRSTSPCPGSPASRSICTSTRTPRKGCPCCCTVTRRCGCRSTSRTRAGPATRW
jgi:MFS family permease